MSFPLSPNRYPPKAFGRRCPHCREWTMRLPTVFESAPITVHLPGQHDNPCSYCGWQRPC